MAAVRDKTSNLGTSTSATMAITWPTNPVVGSKVLVWVAQNGTAPPTLADNGIVPATWVLDQANNPSLGIFIFRADNITMPASGSFTVTVTRGGGTDLAGGGRSYLGLAAGGPVAANNGAGTGTAVSTGAVTPTTAGCVFFGAFQDASALNPETITLTGSGFTTVLTNTNGSSYQASSSADKIASGTGAQTCTWTLGDSVAWNAAMVAYAPATYAAPTVPFFPAGYEPQQADFTSWWTTNAQFFQSRVVFRGRQTLASTSLPSSGAQTLIGIDTVDEDPENGFLSGTNAWMPKVSGWYQVTIDVQLASLATGVQLRPALGGTAVNTAVGTQLGAVSHAAGSDGEFVVYLVGGSDYVQVLAQIQNASAAISTSITAGTQSSMEVVWLCS